MDVDAIRQRTRDHYHIRHPHLLAKSSLRVEVVERSSYELRWLVDAASVRCIAQATQPIQVAVIVCSYCDEKL